MVHLIRVWSLRLRGPRVRATGGLAILVTCLVVAVGGCGTSATQSKAAPSTKTTVAICPGLRGNTSNDFYDYFVGVTSPKHPDASYVGQLQGEITNDPNYPCPVATQAGEVKEGSYKGGQFLEVGVLGTKEGTTSAYLRFLRRVDKLLNRARSGFVFAVRCTTRTTGTCEQALQTLHVT
jgi:hypothetical protein